MQNSLISSKNSLILAKNSQISCQNSSISNKNRKISSCNGLNNEQQKGQIIHCTLCIKLEFSFVIYQITRVYFCQHLLFDFQRKSCPI